ncbi:Cytochrome P450 2U1 [Hypsibius exemplaris]|uniref:Cytochrome P450 2U1 n=1 Tax=Hypsibius exemplaris TaxID=2072580 RepID=A0A9X6NQ20_HYPEX|nr:Cytochrome P450 2U1 [Hypsibius exemplaris]
MDWSTFLLALLPAVLASLYFWSSTFSRRKNFPPGPTGIPFFGNILSFGKQPPVTMLRWKEQFGDIYGLHVGRKPLVVLSDFNTIKKVFGDDAAAGREQSSPIRHDIATGAGSGLIFSQDDLWRTHRRFALSTLRDLGMGKNWLEDSIIAEVEGLCQTLRDTEQKPFDPKEQLTNSVSNVICALIFGQRFDLKDPKFTQLTTMLTTNIQNVDVEGLAEVMPFLMWFPNRVRDRVMTVRRNLRSLAVFFKDQVDEHARTKQRDEVVPDYLYAYQAEAENRSKTVAENTFDEPQLLSSLFDLFIAGSETTSTTTLWAFVYMIENPEVMWKVQAEIDQNIGRDRVLTNADRGLLPYTEATLLEIQRCASLVPLSVPHTTRSEMNIDGYIIPKDTVLLANLYSVHRDPRYWEKPEKFDPTRFLDEKEKLIRHEGFAPFSVGKRACLGESLAKMELFLFIANLLRSFNLRLPAGKTLSHEDYHASVVNCPNPFQLIFEPRT